MRFEFATATRIIAPSEMHPEVNQFQALVPLHTGEHQLELVHRPQ